MNSVDKQLLVTASVLGALGVILGAFAAHGLQNILSLKEIASFQTGVRYQFYHTFFMLILATVPILSKKSKKIIYWFTLVGIILFSGSIYLLNIDEPVLGINLKSIALVTPLGGLLLIIAWFLLFIDLLRTNIKN